MNIGISENEISRNDTSAVFTFATVNITPNNSSEDNSLEETIRFIQSSVAALGILTNVTVIIVFLNHKKLRRKIPNIFIINQVCNFRYKLLNYNS